MSRRGTNWRGGERCAVCGFRRADHGNPWAPPATRQATSGHAFEAAPAHAGRQQPIEWRPMRKGEKIEPTDERVAAARAQAEAEGHDPDEIEAMLRAPMEMWRNDRYVATVDRDPTGWIRSISVRRTDRKPDIPWRHLQRIKNDIAGDEAEAIELFPAESRLVDTANQRWLWLPRPGVKLDIGFTGGRNVKGPESAAAIGARQAPLDP